MLFGLGIVVVLAGVGAFIYARYDMEARIRGYGGAIDDIGYGRGGWVPTQESFEAQARSAAERLGLELVSFEVIRTEESGRDAVGELVQQRIGDRANLRMEIVRYEVRASVVARKWIFSRSGELSVDRTYRREVQLEVPHHRPPPTVPDQPETPRGL
jgi:hypothetical protein